MSQNDFGPKSSSRKCTDTRALKQISDLEVWKSYRAEDAHECGLIVARVNALVATQALLASSAAIILSSSFIDLSVKGILILALSLIALVLIWLSWVALSIGCSVLDRWHEGATEVFEGTVVWTRMWLSKRRDMPDVSHKRSVNRWAMGSCYAFLALWIMFAGLGAGIYTRLIAVGQVAQAAPLRRTGEDQKAPTEPKNSMQHKVLSGFAGPSLPTNLVKGQR